MRFESDGHKLVAKRQFCILWSFLRAAAYLAALPAAMAVDGRYEAAVESATVASHMRHRPSRHGVSVNPSSRFLSVLMRPASSLVGLAEMPVRVRERCK